MRLLIQRVKNARVEVDEKIVGSIGAGALVFFGSHKDDKMGQVSYLTNKLIHLRIFSDAEDKMNLSLLDCKGEILIVSQFTLYGDCKEGRRPSFFEAAGPDLANSFYEAFVKDIASKGIRVETGLFGAKMQVFLQNDGPVTLLIDAP